MDSATKKKSILQTITIVVVATKPTTTYCSVFFELFFSKQIFDCILVNMSHVKFKWPNILFSMCKTLISPFSHFDRPRNYVNLNLNEKKINSELH